MTTKTDTEQLRAEFEAWWKKEGQYCRAGGGEYEKTFAYRAYQAGRAALQSQKPKGNDIMLSGVIRMPFEMAMADPISRMQFYQRAQQALNELEALQSQAQIPAPTNRDEYIALLDRAIDMGKRLNVMWEEAFAEVGVKHGLQSQDREDVADMFWDADDTEDCLYAYDEETAVERMVEKAWPTDFPLHFTLQRAVRLPSLNIKVTSMSDCGTDIQYEREAIDHARRIEGDEE